MPMPRGVHRDCSSMIEECLQSHIRRHGARAGDIVSLVGALLAHRFLLCEYTYRGCIIGPILALSSRKLIHIYSESTKKSEVRHERLPSCCFAEGYDVVSSARITVIMRVLPMRYPRLFGALQLFQGSGEMG